MTNVDRFIDRLRLAQEIGNELVTAYDNEQFLSDTVGQIGAKLRYQGVCIAIEEGMGNMTWAWTGDYGQTRQTRRVPVESSSGGESDDIMDWAVEQGVLTRDELHPEKELPHLDGLQSTLDTSIMQDKDSMGTLSIESQTPDAFDDEDRYILEFLASQISIAIDKSQLLSQERKKSEYLSLVSDVVRKTAGILTVPELCKLATQLIHQHFAYASVLLFLEDAVQPVLVLQASAGEYHDNLPAGYEQSKEKGIIGHVFQTGQPILNNDIKNDPKYYSPFPDADQTRAEFCVPLRTGDRTIGVIDIQNTQQDHLFDQVDQLAMTGLAGQIAIAIGNALLFQDLEQSIAKETRLQEQLIQSEKLSAMGQLVAGVIHELNNPLTSVIGFADLALLREQESRTGEDLKRIAQEARRMSQIVKNLLAFARREKPVRQLINMNALLNDVHRIRAYNLRVTNIQVIEEYDPSLPFTVGDPNQIRQVFLNIITNAEQAIRKAHSRGRITIKTSCESIDNRQIIRVDIKDSGTGIADTHISKIFDPFFTTKKSGEGTGLGLSISYGIIQEHEGRLRVESPPHEGACFIVELPVNSNVPDGEHSVTDQENDAAVSVKQVLVVDDENDIVDYLTRALKMRNHNVDTANDGETAWQYITNNQYDLIICDLKMPGLTGQRLYENIKGHDPKILERLVLMTGDVISTEAQQFLGMLKTPYLEKPFTFKQLESTIASIFDNEP